MNLQNAFAIGTTLQYIKRSGSIQTTVKGENLLLENFGRLESYIKEADLNHHLQSTISEWINKLEKNYKENQKITEDDAKELFQDTTTWETLINRLLSERQVLELIRTGALNQKALIDTAHGEPSAFFDKKTWDSLSNIEKSDFSDAARCLLTGIPTPAVMVALRGAEATVKKYCEFKTGESSKKKTWGSIVEELESRAKELKIQDTFLGYLDYIRDAKRNFAEHPNKTFGQREAELIFMEVLNLVQDTYAEILQVS